MMKTTKIIIAFLMLFAINKVSAQQVTNAEMQVIGLTCSMCSQATEKALRTLDYVANVSPDLNKNLFVISFKKGKAVNFDQLSKKVKDAGFAVGKLEVTLNFNQEKIDENGEVKVDNTIYRFVNTKNRVLNGPIKVTFIDKNFLSANAYKQKLVSVKMDSYATGSATVNGKKVRVYHLSI